GLNQGTTYYFAMKISDEVPNESGLSNVVSAKTNTPSSGGGSSGGSSGGGGGGGSSVDLTTPYRLPTTVSSSLVSIYRPLDLSGTGGNFARPVKIYSYYSKKLSAEIPQETKVTTSTGAAYAGSIAAPTSTSTSSVSRSVGDKKVYAAFSIGSSSQSLRFDKPVKLTIPLTLDVSENVSNIKVFYYNSASNSYKLAGDGGTVSADEKLISVEVDHFTTFAVIESVENEVVAGGTFELQSSEIADPFTDIGGHWAENYIDDLRLTGSINGKSEGIFAPNESLTRAELVKIVVNLYALTIPTEIASKPFNDVEIDAWYAPYVAAAKNAGIIGGYSDETFRPEQLVSRVEALKIVLEATGLTIVGGEMDFPDTEQGQWYEKYVAFSKLNGIVNGYANGNFGPADSITRAEFSKVSILTTELPAAQ
ncbi:MAG: S-layer homology domain-containing protein, partial [Patescibacteria group bacterium]